MTSGDEILYFVAIKPEPEYEELFNRWYDTEHLPELLACPGFLGAWRYHIVRADTEDAPEYLAFYRIQSMAAFETPEYLALRARTEDELSPLARESKGHRQLLINAKYQLMGGKPT